MVQEHYASIEQIAEDIELRVSDIRNSYLLQAVRIEEKLAQLEAVVARLKCAMGRQVDSAARWVN